MERNYWDAELDTMPWNEVLAWQRSHFPDFTKRLRDESAWHAAQLADADLTTLADPAAWAAVATVTKDDLRRSQENTTDFMLGPTQVVADDRISQVIASSGTTGTPTFFGVTAADRAAWEFSIANMYFTAGIRKGTVVAHTVGMPMVAGGMAYAEALRKTGATLVWVGGQTTERTVEIFRKLGVDAMVATASFATFLGEWVADRDGAGTLKLATVIGGGEPGLNQPSIRAKVRRVWDADRVSETMGLGDVMPGMWGECEQEDGMHFTGARNVYVELINPETGEPVPWEEGAEGEAVYTTFTREAMPVVRYRSRDHMLVVGTSCPCGRTAPRVRCIGRTDDMLIYKAMNVFPSAIRDVTLVAAGDRITGVMRLRKDNPQQVRFDDPIPLELEVLEGADFADVSRVVEDAVRQRLRVRVEVEPLSPGSLPKSLYKSALTYVRQED